MHFSPQQAILTLGDPFYDPVAPADFPQTILRFRNDRAAATVGLETLTDAQWIAHFGRFQPFEGSLPRPLALRYHGHQFRSYNPDIGDGRGFLFAQMRDEAGRLMDFGTKGSGQTPYSRFGDGRLTLKGGVREILATEMLQALGVNTSKSFSLIETGEALHRGDEPSPTRSAVLVRLSHSHVRIGVFQRLAYEKDAESMRALVAYVLANLHGSEGGPVELLQGAITRCADLAASYMVAGFVHGVLNTDNINITGESFDYGPWRFTPEWDPGFTAAYFDHAGLYSFGRQPEALYWNVMQLAAALRLVSDEAPLIAALDSFPDAYETALTAAMLRRLGLAPTPLANPAALVLAIDGTLRETKMPIDRFFFESFGGNAPEGPAFDEIRRLIADFVPARTRDHPYWSDAQPCSMHIEEVEAIWSAIDERDDWGPLHDKVAAIRRMGEALA
ncbi:YdiU family protein [Sphingomonas sp. AOB5]|uniref:protein adenylyltransferase SelO family protein n=1 Tax=Sphingomonas sp. AOB5 TaxID=3034017 RepID=UPI0023F81082|nr:YdiU family protein [Sphingomonas sp. AOB5]MDF7774543.1 YdiU family protein [Sphingomonas sp. AOB5]